MKKWFVDTARNYFLKDSYQVRFDSMSKHRFLFLWWSGFIVALCFRFILWIVLSLFGDGLHGIVALSNLIIIALLCVPGYSLLKIVLSKLDDDLRLRFEIGSILKDFCINNKFADNYSPVILYSFNEEYLTVKFRLDGHQISKKFIDLEQQLSNMFVLALESSEVIQGYAVYVFRRNEIAREKVSDILEGDKVVDIVNDTITLNDKYKWNFRTCPHGLITGITGSGKTFFFAYFIVMFLKFKSDFRIIDPKRADLFYLSRYFGDKVVYSKDKALRILREAGELIDKRMESFQSRPDFTWGKDYSFYKEVPHWIIFDEAAAFVALLDKKGKEEYDKHVAKIILEGRQAGVFVIFAMQRSDTEFIKGALRDMLGLRVILSRASNDGYKMVFGNYGKDLALTDSKAGFYMDLTMNCPKEFYTPYLDIDFIKEIEKLIDYKSENIDLQKKIN